MSASIRRLLGAPFKTFKDGTRIRFFNTVPNLNENVASKPIFSYSKYLLMKKNTELPTITFLPMAIINKNEATILKKSPILDRPYVPISSIISIIDKTPLIEAPTIENILECPNNEKTDEKQAARLIVIRRRKMNRHKLKKLRKRMRFDIRKRNQRKALRREKHFQFVMLSQVKKAERFSPEKYVHSKLKMANTRPLPRTWKGKRLPKFIIRQLVGLDPKVNYKDFPRISPAPIVEQN